jgi:hypothetical protein
VGLKISGLSLAAVFAKGIVESVKLFTGSSDNPILVMALTRIVKVADTVTMTKPSPANSGKEMTTVYGKIPRKLADRLDQLAGQRRWSRAQMVAFCIEHFIENQGSNAAGQSIPKDD